MSKFKLALIVLLIATIIIQGYSSYVYAKVIETNSAAYFCYIVFPLEHEPEKYWILTEPDPYILEAIEHPGNWTEPFFYKDSTFWFTAEWHSPEFPLTSEFFQLVPFKYNGTYYDYGAAGSNTRIRVELLDEEPEEYVNLTNPDKYMLEGIENPGKRIAVKFGVAFKGPGSPFQYNGKYYACEVMDVLLECPSHEPVKPEYTAMALAGVWGAIGSVYFLKKRKAKVNLIQS